jgi:cation diffusion facilitator CzcD-associated flavoprotein CzcO
MGSIGYKVTSDEYAHPLISERAIDEPRPLKVIYIGAGVSGICAAIQFPKAVPNLEFAIYEKNADVGGTWFENRCVLSSKSLDRVLTISRYPGCACGIVIGSSAGSPY